METNIKLANRNLALPYVIAHRGSSGQAPENTLASLRSAKADGAQWVECDLQLTQDGHVVVFHDKQLERTTNGQGQLSELKLEALQALDSGSWFGPSFQHERIPTLKQWLLCAHEQGLSINLELKANANDDEVLVKKTLELIKRHWPISNYPPLLSSASINCLKLLNAYECPYPKGLIVSHRTVGLTKQLKKLQCASLHIDHWNVDKTLIQRVKNQGCHVLCYTVNELQRAQDLLEWGATAVFTDNEAVIKLLS